MSRGACRFSAVSSASGRNGRVTINDVAKRAGVSRSTTSRVLGGYGVASEDARESVLKAAQDLGYHVNALARAMITGKTYTLGVVLADIENDYFARLARGAADAAKLAGFEILLANTDEDLQIERKAIQVLLDKQVDGIVIAPASSGNAEHLAQAKKRGIPMVLVDRKIPSLKADTVGIDNRSAANDAVERLIEAGHRRIGMVTSAHFETPESSKTAVNTGHDRVAGYRDALMDAGIKPEDVLLRRGSYSSEAARAQTRTMMSLTKPPTAIFASDNVMLLGVFRGIQDLGLRIPEDVSVVGLDDSDWTEIVTPRLSVIEQPVYEIGRLAVERLVARINGDNSKAKDHVLQHTWVGRDSISRAAKRAK